MSRAKLGTGVYLPQPGLVNLYGCVIGDNTKIAAFVEIQKGVSVGKNCKIQSFVFIPTGVTIGNEVFVGPHVCFTNDKYPAAVNEKGELLQEGDWPLVETFISDNAVIGARSTILPGITIGEGAIIGAGSVVTKDVPPGETWVGNPARRLKNNVT